MPAAGTSAEPDSLAARMQAVEIVVTETLAALVATRPGILAGITASAKRHTSRLSATSDDTGFALELDRQTARLLRNMALAVGIAAALKR